MLKIFCFNVQIQTGIENSIHIIDPTNNLARRAFFFVFLLFIYLFIFLRAQGSLLRLVGERKFLSLPQ